MSQTPIFTEVTRAQEGAKQVGEFFGRKAERLSLADDLQRILTSKSMRRDLEALLKKLQNT